MSEEHIGELARVLGRARRVLVFTGAGISTGSGIPDFRGPGGVWTRRQPVYFQDFVASEAARREYWEFKLEGWPAFRDAAPGAAHRAIVELEQRGVVELVVTQNVDGLHQVAGTARDRLVELHGTNAEVVCIECGRREPPDRCMRAFEATREPPRCVRRVGEATQAAQRSCNGLMKPAVVMFGEALDMKLLARAFAAAEAADLVLALGSSLVVTPAADVPLRAAARGTPYVIVNRGETPHDELATLRIDADVGEVLARAVALA